VKETDWLNFEPVYYKCDKAKGVDLLIINGKKDLVVPYNGIIETKEPTNQDTFSNVPATYSVWNFARENVKPEDKKYFKNFQSFNLTKTFDNTSIFDKHGAQCK